ncbi:hypothetical protein H0H93_000078 [Arthromyces matolae]|nr:hypothetical protein H0H93_000078 [Arthromyces matolae]
MPKHSSAPLDGSLDTTPSHSKDDPAISLKKKKKKRRREEDVEVHENTPDTTEKRKKKKKKKRHAETENEAAAALDSASGVVQPDLQPNEASHGIGSIDDPNFDTPEVRDAAAALLSALVAATTGSRDSVPPSSYTEQLNPAMLMQHPPMEPTLFPFVPYGYDLPLMPLQPDPSSSSLFPTGASLPLNELSFGSNDDVLRALQSLDMSRITSVLGNIGDDHPQHNEVQPTARPSVLHGNAPPAPRVPTRGRLPVNINPAVANPNNMINPDHAWLLATKWLSATKLAELVRTEGLIYKKGKFSATEDELLKKAIERFQTTRGFTDEQIQELIFPASDRNRDNVFWSELTSAVPLRPIIAVYHHIRRTYHPLKTQGPWDETEDNLLKNLSSGSDRAVAENGQAWEKISPLVGRMPSDCRDRWRNHIVNREIRVTGFWSKEEEDQLIRIVTDMTVRQGKDLDSDVFWGKVSDLMGGKRGRQQCRIKWTDALCKTVKTGGQRMRWSTHDAYILIHKLSSLDVRDDTEIDWKLLPDPVWNLWSPHTLQRRWLTMKRGIKGWESMTHQEILDILRARKGQAPPPSEAPLRKKRERRIVSAASVQEDGVGSESSDSDSETAAVAGSSKGPDTLGNAKNAAASSSDSDSSDSD